MSLDTEAPVAYVSAAPLVYHAGLAPWLTLKIACLRRSETQVLDNVVVFAMLAAVAWAFVADEQTRSAHDHQHKGFGRHTGVRIHHAKPVTTRLPQLDKGGELARLVGLRG